MATAPTKSRWVGKSLWSFLDQGLFALSNFALNILLARWLAESEYGLFSTAFAVFLLLGVLYNALLVEPMLVFGPGKFQGAFQGYLAILRRLHWQRAALTTAIIGAIVALFYLDSEALVPLLTLSAVSGLIFRQWMLRRACYVRMEPEKAAQGGLLYFITIFAGAFILDRTNALSTISAILLMAGGSIVASCWIHARLTRAGSDEKPAPKFETVVIEHWKYGKWAVLTGFVSWFPANIYLLLMPEWQSEASAGALRACFNLAMPMLQVVATVGTVILPFFVRSRERPDFRRLCTNVLVVLTAACAAYVGLMFFIGEWLFRLAYKGKFADFAESAWLVSSIVIPAATVTILGSILRALEASKKVFYAYVASSIACAAIGLPLMAKYNVIGAAAGMGLSSVVASIAMAVLILRASRPVAA